MCVSADDSTVESHVEQEGRSHDHMFPLHSKVQSSPSEGTNAESSCVESFKSKLK